jgi:hypothetical protein
MSRGTECHIKLVEVHLGRVGVYVAQLTFAAISTLMRGIPSGRAICLYLLVEQCAHIF